MDKSNESTDSNVSGASQSAKPVDNLKISEDSATTMTDPSQPREHASAETAQDEDAALTCSPTAEQEAPLAQEEDVSQE